MKSRQSKFPSPLDDRPNVKMVKFVPFCSLVCVDTGVFPDPLLQVSLVLR